MEGLQWGKPGPGGAYWRNSALTGQNFFDKMVTYLIDYPRLTDKYTDIINRVGVGLLIPERDSLRPSTVRLMR